MVEDQRAKDHFPFSTWGFVEQQSSPLPAGFPPGHSLVRTATPTVAPHCCWETQNFVTCLGLRQKDEGPTSTAANKPVCLRAPCLFSIRPFCLLSCLLPPPRLPPLTPSCPPKISAAVPGQQRQRQPGLREDQAGEGGAGHAGGTLGKEAPPHLPLSLVACLLTADSPDSICTLKAINLAWWHLDALNWVLNINVILSRFLFEADNELHFLSISDYVLLYTYIYPQELWSFACFHFCCTKCRLAGCKCLRWHSLKALRPLGLQV